MKVDVTRARVASRENLDELAMQWKELHSRSTADPLFMSWDWMERWWHHHQNRFEADLLAFIAKDASKRVLGIALLTARNARHRGGFSGRRFELCGNFWRESDVVMSERIGFLLDKQQAPTTAKALWDAILEHEDWDDLVLTHVDARCETLLSSPSAKVHDLYVRANDRLDAYEVPLSGSFAQYVTSLRYGARRRIISARNRLPPGTQHAYCTSAAELIPMLARHDTLHRARWGVAAFAGRRGAMYEDLAKITLARGSLALHGLVAGDCFLATSFNIRAGAREYVLQSAFDESRSRGFAPGHLLVGYVIERAFNDRIEAVDLLGGSGRTTQFKSGYGARHSRLESIQLVRSRFLKALYSTYDRWRRNGAPSASSGVIES